MERTFLVHADDIEIAQVSVRLPSALDVDLLEGKLTICTTCLVPNLGVAAFLKKPKR